MVQLVSSSSQSRRVPSAIGSYARSLPHPVAAIGCRTSGFSHECCEYDLVVFTQESGANKVVEAEGFTVELIHLANRPSNHIVELYGMEIIKDSNTLQLGSVRRELRPEKYRLALTAAGKKSLVASLFYHQKMKENLKNPTLAGIWAKISAYQFVEGILALSGKRPMPLHELEQIRQTDSPAATSDGIQSALECIGIERATRPAISRSIQGVRELKSKDYDKDLAISKARHLLEKQMLSDCYYYLGRIASESLVKMERRDSFYVQYAKLIQISMDLTSDVQHLQKLQRSMFRAANACLRS